MLLEKNFEDLICKYPELIEEDLVFKDRQLTLYGRRIDILFEDKFKRKLIVELKVGPIKDEHIGQILSYEGMLLSAEDPTIRVMLVGNRVPPNIQRSLDHHGIAWKEITISQLNEFLTKKENKETLNSLKEDRSLKLAQEKINDFSIHELVTPNFNVKKGLLFYCSFKEKDNIDDAIEHLDVKKNKELYWSIGRSVNKADFPLPYNSLLVGLINMKKRIVGRCIIKMIKEYEISDHGDSSKKPLGWIEDEKQRLRKLKERGEVEKKRWQVTLVISEMKKIDSGFETSQLKLVNGEELGRITQTPRTILVPVEFQSGAV